MPAMKRVWAIVSPTICWHSDQNCPILVDSIRHTVAYRVSYPDADTAWKFGHIRECERCKRIVMVEDEGREMMLTVEQIATLRAIQKIYNELKHPITLALIAGARDRCVSTCFYAVRTLESKGLVYKGRGWKNGKGGSISPSPAAARVLAKL